MNEGVTKAIRLKRAEKGAAANLRASPRTHGFVKTHSYEDFCGPRLPVKSHSPAIEKRTCHLKLNSTQKSIYKRGNRAIILHPRIHRWRIPMAVLKSLTFTALLQPGADPTWTVARKSSRDWRSKSVLLNDPNYTRTVRTWTKKDGEKTAIEKHKRVLPWWRIAPDGSFVFFIRAGHKPIEFEKGKSAIAVPSLDKLPSVIDTLIDAVRNGELDDQLAQASKMAVARKTRRAA